MTKKKTNFICLIRICFNHTFIACGIVDKLTFDTNEPSPKYNAFDDIDC